MRPFLTWILRHRIVTVLVIAAVTGLLAVEARKIQINTDFVTYLSQDSEVVQEFYRAGAVFESNYMAMVVFDPSNGESLFSKANLTILSELTERYGRIDGISSVMSIANAADVKETPYGISVEDLLGGELPREQSEIREMQFYVVDKELYRGTLIDRTGESALLLLTFEPSADHIALADEVISETAATSGSTDGFYFGGMPFVMYSMSQGIVANLSLLVPLILLFLIAVLYLAFRSVSGVLFPLLVVAVSAVWSVGILSILGVPLDILTAIMPVILIAMGSADGIHLMRKYSEERENGQGPGRAMIESVGELGLPILLTSVTTMVGFASLVVSDFRIIKTFGLAVTLAIFLALLVTLLLLPPLAVLFGSTTDKSRTRPRETSLSHLMERLAEFVHRRHRAILLGFGSAALLAVVGVPLISVNVDWSLCLARNSKPYAAEMLLRDRFGGSLPLQVSIEGNVRDPAVLQATKGIQEYASIQAVVENPRSVADLVSEMNYVLNGTYAVPNTPEGVANLWLLMEGEEVLEQFVNSGESEALIQGRVTSMATSDIRASTSAMTRYLNQVPSKFHVIDKELLPAEGRSVAGILQAGIAAGRVSRSLDLTIRQQEDLDARFAAVITDSRGAARRRVVEASARSYLNSDESEIGRIPGEVVSSIANATAKLAGGDFSENPPTPEALAETLASFLPRVPAEDRYWLADSLLYEISEALRRTRNDALLNEARAIITNSSLRDDTEKRVRGIIAESTGDIAFVPHDGFIENQLFLQAGLVRDVPVKATLTGMVPVLTEMEERLLPTQIKSVAITIGVVLLLLVFVLRSLKSGIIALVPTLLTILTNFAVLGFAGIGLDSFTALIASAVIGLGIDYAIHLVTKYRREFSRTGESREAMRITLRTTGIAILINALSVGLGFELLNFAAGQHIRIFGGLLGLSLLASALYTLVLLPALLIAFRDHPIDTSPQTETKQGAIV